MEGILVAKSDFLIYKIMNVLLKVLWFRISDDATHTNKVNKDDKNLRRPGVTKTCSKNFKIGEQETSSKLTNKV